MFSVVISHCLASVGTGGSPSPWRQYLASTIPQAGVGWATELGASQTENEAEFQFSQLAACERVLAH